MQSSDIPGKLAKPFAANAGGGFIRSIPVNSQIGITDGAASLTDGFVPLNFLPIASGGVPPFGADMNGILFEISGWTRWAAAGGPIYFDGAFATLVGGYPKGAVVQSSITPGVMFVSTAENNSTNPESGGVNWISLSPVPATLAELRAGTDTVKYVTSATLAGLRAVLADLVAGTDLAKYVTPKALADLRASGMEVLVGTDPAKYISPLTLAGALLNIGTIASNGNGSFFNIGTTLIQLGFKSSTNGTFNFPTPFGSCLGIYALPSAMGAKNDAPFGYPVSSSQFYLATKAADDGHVTGFPCYWIAVGTTP